MLVPHRYHLLENVPWDQLDPGNQREDKGFVLWTTVRDSSNTVSTIRILCSNITKAMLEVPITLGGRKGRTSTHHSDGIEDFSRVSQAVFWTLWKYHSVVPGGRADVSSGLSPQSVLRE